MVLPRPARGLNPFDIDALLLLLLLLPPPPPPPPLRFLTRCDGKLREPFVWRQGSQVSMRMVRGSTSLLSRYGTGIGPQDTLKKDSQGLSQNAAENPGFTRLVPVTAESFSGCLCPEPRSPPKLTESLCNHCQKPPDHH